MVEYNRRTGTVTEYQPRYRSIDPDVFMDTVRAAIAAAAKEQALSNRAMTPVGNGFTLGPGTTSFLGQMRTNAVQKKIEKDGPEAYFKGKDRSDLSPELRRMYDNVQKAKKESGWQEKTMGGLGRVLDVMSRFNYGSAEAVKRVWRKSMEEDDDSWIKNLGEAFVDAGEGFVQGVKGKDKTTFSNVLQTMKDSEKALQDGKDPNKVKYGYNELGTGDKILKGVLGFTFDVALDPTTYVGIGVVKSALKGAGVARKGDKIGKIAPDADKMGDYLYDVGVKINDIDDAMPIKMFLDQKAVVGDATQSAMARSARIRDSQTFVATAKATVMAKETARYREVITKDRALDFREVPEDIIEKGPTRLVDVPDTPNMIAEHVRYTEYKGSLGSKKAVLNKRLADLQKRISKTNHDSIKTNVKGTDRLTAKYSDATRVALNRQIVETKEAIAKIDAEYARINSKYDEMVNAVELDPEKLKAVSELANDSAEVKALDKAIQQARDDVKRIEKRHARVDAKNAKAAEGTANAGTKAAQKAAAEKKPTPTNKPSAGDDLVNARARLSDLLSRKRSARINAMEDAALKVAPDKGTLTSKLRRESDISILRQLAASSSNDGVAHMTALRRELAYRFNEKGDKWLAAVVKKAGEQSDGLVEDLKNLTPLKRPPHHTLRANREIVQEETLVKPASKTEVAAANAHNARVMKEIEREASRKAKELADEVEGQLLEMMVRETTPHLKRGLAIKINMLASKNNTPETAKVMFTLALPDAVHKAVSKYVFRDTFKEGLVRWSNFFKSSAGTDPLLNSMRLSYNGAAGFRIEEHAKRLRNLWQGVNPAHRRAGLRQWIRYGDKIDADATGPYAEIVKQINDEVNLLTQVMKVEYPNGFKVTAADFNNWLPDNLKFGKIDDNLPVGSPEWVRASLRHIAEDADPAELLWHLNIAREKVLVRTAMKDNIRALFGFERHAGNDDMAKRLIKDYGYKEVPELGPNHLFPGDVADDVVKTFDLMKNQKQMNGLIQFYDNMLTIYKSTVTMYNPGYHARNSFGDSFMNYLAGVSGVQGIQAYKHSAKILKSLKGISDDSPIHQALMDINPKAAFANVANRPNTVIFKHHNKDVSAEEVWVLYNHYGLHSGFVSNEFGQGFGRPGSLRSTVPGKAASNVNRGVQGLSENREDFFRLAHFVHVLRQSKNPNLDRAAFEAASSVRKYLFDYSDFTQVEKATMIRLIPFYKWTRKAIPLMAETMFAQPGKALMYPKAMRNISVMLGYDMGDANGVIPASDVIIPEWVRQRGMYPIGTQDGNTVLADAALPFNDVVRTVSAPTDSFFSMLTPGLRIPVELKMGKRFYGDIPITDRSEYAGSSVPQGAFLQQMLKKNAEGEANGVVGNLTDPRTLQFLSGIGLHENTERQMENELRNQSYDISQANRNRKKKNGGNK